MNNHTTQAQIPNPALQALGVLVGEWEVSLSFPANPSMVGQIREIFEWIEGGAFLVMYTQGEQAGPPQSIWVIGRDDSQEIYQVLYFDSRGVSRVYQMSLQDGVWKQWRDAPGFSQRFTGTFSADRNTITAKWEKMQDGLTWEHDFDLTYKRKT